MSVKLPTPRHSVADRYPSASADPRRRRRLIWQPRREREPGDRRDADGPATWRGGSPSHLAAARARGGLEQFYAAARAR
jgi:hypothetical protein